MKVLVNPITKAPTAFAFPEHLAPIFEGQYQNCAEVTEEQFEALAIAPGCKSTA